MHEPQTHDGAALERLWLQVCASRGTPAPEPGRRGAFLQGLGPEARSRLESVLALAARGREGPGELGLLGWAAACTRPALLEQLQRHGLGFASAQLFTCGLQLMAQGWDMQPRLAQLHSHPQDVQTLRALLGLMPGESQEEAEAEALAMAAPPGQAPAHEAHFPWPADSGHRGDDSGDIPAHRWEGAPMDEPPAALPTRFARQRPDALADTAGAPDEHRLRLRLFGKAAAHTLEVSAHRRGADFLGVQVVSIDSARALASGAGYDWARKLVIQLTPEEMPAAIATLMGLTPSVRFAHHGAKRDKFIELRRQEGGLLMVTGERGVSHPVPVSAASACYVLDLFCRAMASAAPGRSVCDVLMLVRSAHGL